MTPNSFSKISFIFPILIAHFYTVLAQGANATQEAIVLEAVTKLGWAFTYPNSSKEAESINSTLFADNVQGRVDITNTFDGPELNTEYVFGLFANIAKNNTFSLLPVPISSQTRGLIINGNMAATSAVINFRHAATGIEMPMVVDTWIRVNDEGKIDQYEATFKRHDWYFDVLYGLLTPFVANSQNISVDTLNNNITYRDTIFQKLVGESVCKIHEEYCTGENQQYASVDDCMGFMMSIPLGQMYQLGQNTGLCRMLHQEMVPERPSVHCAHIGPSGGDMCVDRNYTEVTEEVYFRSLFIQGM